MFLVRLAMSCPVPLLLPDECKQVLLALRSCKVLSLVSQAVATYLWSFDWVFVASRDGYLRILFDGVSVVYMRHFRSAVWCLCYAWGNLYVSLYDRGLVALPLSEHLPQRHEFVGHYTFLCLCSTSDGVCAGAYNGLVYLFSPNLERLRVVDLHPLGGFARQVYCCLPALENVLLGCERGSLHRLSALSSVSSTRNDVVKSFSSAIFCLRFTSDGSLLCAGLEDDVDVSCATSYTSIFRIPCATSVWSISARPGSDVVAFGLRFNGIAIVRLHAEAILRGRDRRASDDAFYSVQCLYTEIGTCSAISHATNGKNGNWYAASNRSRIYTCSAGGTISSSLVAWPVQESEDHGRVPRRDIYDVLVISNVSVFDHPSLLVQTDS